MHYRHGGINRALRDRDTKKDMNWIRTGHIRARTMEPNTRVDIQGRTDRGTMVTGMETQDRATGYTGQDKTKAGQGTTTSPKW